MPPAVAAVRHVARRQPASPARPSPYTLTPTPRCERTGEAHHPPCRRSELLVGMHNTFRGVMGGSCRRATGVLALVNIPARQTFTKASDDRSPRERKVVETKFLESQMLAWIAVGTL